MGVITYTALRSLAAGHTSQTQYQLETAFNGIDPDTQEQGSLLTMLDGGTEYDFDHLAEFIALLTDVVEHDDLPLWKEFLHSVSGREIFSVDVEGTIAVPVNVQSCQLHRGNYKPQRDGNRFYRFSFVVRLL